MKKGTIRAITIIWAALMIAVLSSTATLLISGRGGVSLGDAHWVTQQENDTLQRYTRLEEVRATLMEDYYQELDESQLLLGAIHGMTFPAMMLPAVVLGSLSDLMIPTLARTKAAGDRAGMERMLRICLRTGLLYALGVMGFFLLCGRSLGQLVYHNETAGRYLGLFAPVLLILYLDAIVDGLLKGLIEQVASMRYNTLTSALEVALLWVLLPRYGVDGFFFSFVLTHGLNFFLSIARLLKVTRFAPRWGYVCRAAGAAGFALLLTALATAPLETAPLLPTVLVRGGLFLGLMALGCRLSRLTLRPEPAFPWVLPPKA